MQSTHPPIQAFHPTMTLFSLNQMACGEVGVVESLPDVSLLASLGIRLGKSVKMVAKCLAKGPCILHVNDRSVVIDRAIAERIFIRK